jgi:imidazolonepropionase-like amidohydrolase
MKLARGTTHIRHGRLVDGTGGPPIDDATVAIVDGIITYAGPSDVAPPAPPDAADIDASGCTVMPGLIEAHYHATYFNIVELEQLDIAYPPETVALHSAFNARVTLECGYTSARSAGCLFNTDVSLAAAIDADIVAGPRLSPSGQEICGAGGLMDWNPEFRKIGMEGVILVVDGVEQARSAARKLVKAGAAWLKTYPTGDAAAPGTNDHHTLSMTFDEMAAVVQIAHNHRRKVMGHCRSTEGIKMAIDAGYDSIEHGTFLDEWCIEQMVERRIPCVPALQFELASIKNGPAFGMGQDVVDGHQETLEAGAESARRLLAAGGILGMGGDYGFAWNPHGDYAKELSFFVDYVGFSPMDVIVCGTRNGAVIMGTDDEVGTVEAGKLADVLVVDGDVLADISLLEDQANLRAVMQGGIVKAGRLAEWTPAVVPTP